MAVLAVIWPVSLVCGLPTAVYNTLRRPSRQSSSTDIQLCVLVFPGQRSAVWHTAFKVAEFVLFFLVPVVVQICLYVVIGRKLFVGPKNLQCRQHHQVSQRLHLYLQLVGPTDSGVGTGGGGAGPPDFLFEGAQYDRAPTFEKCRPIFELKVTPYFQMYHQSESEN